MSMEILVHNLSHADLILGVSNSASLLPSDAKSPMVVARPKFSEFNQISHQIYNYCKEQSSDFPLEQMIPECRPGGVSTFKDNGFDSVPAGCILRGHTASCNTNKLRFRNDDLTAFLGNQDACHILKVFFPLLAILIPKWLMNIQSMDTDEKRVILVSGRGKPIDQKAEDSDNSTEYTAKLARLFLQKAYPDLKVELLHSETNLFRYDENIVFVKRELLPCINKFRDQLVSTYRGKWKENMRVTLSFADGTSARVNAINASLRHFRPSYMHFWVLKSFWREKKLYEDDVECHLFEEVATEPAIHTSEADDPYVKQVVEEMAKFREEFTNILSNPNQEHDLANFWLRKTKKPVLAVLLVEKNGVVKLYRGTNMEVSMPTGSLCAERNVIGSALADDVTLMRENIKMIAVYSVNLPINKVERVVFDDSALNPSTATSLALTCDQELPLMTKSPPSCNKRKIIHMPSSSQIQVESETTIPQNVKKTLSVVHPDDVVTDSTPATKKMRHSKLRSIAFASPNSHNDLSCLDRCLPISNTVPNNPVSLVPTMTTISVDDSDMNPLKPCGACNEWLKKIAEVNPNLRVVTFTDAQCNGIYIENIAD